MKTTRLALLPGLSSTVLVAVTALVCAAPVWAADAPTAAAKAASAPATAPATTVRDPHDVQVREAPDAKNEQIVQEDDKVRIEENRVRGLTQKVVVKRKDGAPDYEILTGDSGKDIPVRQGAERGGAGQRVWRVLSF